MRSSVPQTGSVHTAVKFSGHKYRLILFRPISPNCTSCHKDGLAHDGHYMGICCEECHMDKGWKLTKDFHRDYNLVGVHNSLQCQECHRDNRRLAGVGQGGVGQGCYACHQKDDAHEGTLPNCAQCHRQQLWEDVTFKHSLTNFPLRGIHRTLDCSACHSRGIYQGLPSQCLNCHLSDAIGAAAFPHSPISNFLNCTDCHNQYTF